jgi:hypothetical protein
MYKKTEKLKTLAFDFYIYSDRKSCGIYCRNTKAKGLFNNYEKDKVLILKFIDKTKKKWFK